MRLEEKKIVAAARDQERPVVDGPLLYRFDTEKLAAALEMECERARAMGWPKVSLHMDVADALKLAKTLRRR